MAKDDLKNIGMVRVTKGVLRRLWYYKLDHRYKSFVDVIDDFLKEKGY